MTTGIIDTAWRRAIRLAEIKLFLIEPASARNGKETLRKGCFTCKPSFTNWKDPGHDQITRAAAL